MKQTGYIVYILVITGLLFPATAFADAFQDMLTDVEANHPRLKAEREQLQAVKQQVYQSYSGFMPSAGAEYSHGRQRVQYNALPHMYERSTGRSITVTQPLFNGETFARVDVAEAQFAGEEAHFKLVHQQVLLNAIAAYIDMSEKQTVLQIAEENSRALTNHLAATRKQFAAGELTVTDVSQSEARLARSEAELHDAQAAVADAQATYVREVGREPNVGELPNLPGSMPLDEEDIRNSMENHPAVLEARQNENAADHTIRAREANLLPTVRLEGKIDDMQGSSQPGINSNNDRSAMIRVSIPIFQSGAEYSRIAEAKHQYERSRNETVDTVNETLRNALHEWHNYMAAKAAIIEHQRAVNAGEKALDSVRKEQLAGTRTILDILNEQDELYAARINLIHAQSRQVMGAYRVLAAAGILDSTLLYGQAN